MYSEVFCRVYNELGWNYYPEAFGQQLLKWLDHHGVKPEKALDLGCGTGVLCRLLKDGGIDARGMDFSAGMIEIAKEADPGGHYEVADMITYRPEARFDLVTCTGDALNHIPDLGDVKRIFENIHSYLAPGGYLIFDILNGKEGSSDEPFDIDFDETLRVWFQMTRPGPDQVHLKIRAYENGALSFEENIRETVHDPAMICQMLTRQGFRILRCADALEDGDSHGTTWYIIAQK